MELLLGIVICFLIFYMFWFIGHVIRKELNINEDCQLLGHLLSIALGSIAFLTLVNLTSRILNNFNFGIVLTFLAVGYLIYRNLEGFIQTSLFIKDLCINNKFIDLAKEKVDKTFWIVLGILNLIYGLTAFSSTKIDHFGLGDKHIFNIYQISSGSYPPRYSFFPRLIEQFHYGSDVLSALITKFSTLHPELSLDLLTIVFLNLSFLFIYSLTRKYYDSNNLYKYIIPVSAFIVWGPIVNLFSTKGEILPKKFIDLFYYLSQTKLTEAAKWSGSVIYWFFDPPTGFGVFYLLVTLYFIYRFINGEKDLRNIIVTAIVVSSLNIIDISKLLIVVLGTLVYLCCLIFEEYDANKKINYQNYKPYGILFILIVFLGIIAGNWMIFSKDLIPLARFYNFGNSNMDKIFDPFKSNIVLLALYGIGFYTAYTKKDKWNIFIAPFFISSLIIPYFLTIPEAGVGKFIMSSSILGVFTIPFLKDLIDEQIQKQFNLNEEKLKMVHISIAAILCFSTVMFFFFGIKEKPLFNVVDGKAKFTGLQRYFQESSLSDEYKFLKHLRIKNISNKAIVTEPSLSSIFALNAGIHNLFATSDDLNIPVSPNLINSSSIKALSSFSFNKKIWKENNIGLLYLTPTTFRFLAPKAKSILLNSYLAKGSKLSLSNERTDEAGTHLKELYEVNPDSLNFNVNKDFNKQLATFLSNKKNPKYINQIALSPYFGIYSAKSNDFDGDMIADIAFFDDVNKTWTIVYGKTQEEKTIDLKKNLLYDANNDDLFVPVPSDYDGDSKTDIAVANRANGKWYVMRSSDSIIESRNAGVAFGEPFIVDDIDGDGKADPSCYNLLDRRWPALLSGNTYSYSDMSYDTSTTDINLYSDLDGDKKADYLIYRPSDSLFICYLSTRNYSPSDPVRVKIGDSSSRVVPADYDGDGKTDLATWSPSAGAWEVAYAKDFLAIMSTPSNPVQFVGCGVAPIQNNDSNTVSPCSTKIIKLGNPGDIPMPADYDGDGKSDIAIYHFDTYKLEIAGDKEPRLIDLSKYSKYTPAFFIGI